MVQPAVNGRSNILTKLDVHSRAGAVAVAYREGLIGDVSAHGPAVATS